MSKARILLVQPGYGGIEPDSYNAAMRPTQRQDLVHVAITRPCASLLAHGFNLGLCQALNDGYEYFAMLHGDIAPSKGWIDTLLDILSGSDIEMIHVAAPIKDSRGLTSTAIGYSDDEWLPVRRITLAELHRLPETFDVEAIRQELDPEAQRLLPNTGCMLMRADTWLRDFSGFTINDRIIRGDGEWGLDVTPEDWNFGHWCARNGVKVGGTRAVTVKHYGKAGFESSKAWGSWETDEHYHEAKANLQGV